MTRTLEALPLKVQRSDETPPLISLPLTREEVLTVYDQGPEAVLALVERLWSFQQHTLEALEARVHELENRLSKDSHNSGKPPSSDGLKRTPKSLREKREEVGRSIGASGKDVGVSRRSR